MRDYIKGRDEFLLVREYKDDGVSGTRFDRQAFDSLLTEVRKGNINCIIVKDLSRFGRNHMEAGNYLEKIFPFLGVRFISVNDGYDSFDRECADKKLAVILKNLVNEYIAKDTSVKVASGYVIKQENGEYGGGRAPYGYAFADKRKTRFAVDAKPAGVVKDIFTWTMQGDSAQTIVKRLTERKINPPKAYQDTGEFYRQEQERCYWNEVTVSGILQNMAYAGHMALHKWKESKADGISAYKLEKSEWKITKNTHEAIVTEHDFGLVQEILRVRKERYKSLNAPKETIIRPENLLKGKVFCGDCLMPASRMGANYQRKIGKTQERVRIYRYRCRTYREKGAQECTSKSVAEKDLEEIVYQAVMAFIRQTECPDDMILRFHSEFFRKMRKSVEQEKRIEERALCREKNEKILLYQEYSRMKHGSIERSGAERNGMERSGTERSSIERSGTERSGMERSSTECSRTGRPQDGNSSTVDKAWYLKEKQKKEDEIRYHEKRMVQLQEKQALFESLEGEQAEQIKEALADKDTFPGKAQGRLTAQMVSLLIDKIYLYDEKRVEIVMNFKE